MLNNLYPPCSLQTNRFGSVHSASMGKSLRRPLFALLSLVIPMLMHSAAFAWDDNKLSNKASGNSTSTTSEKKLEKATFGSGCYWCTEAVFQRVKGVEKVTSGFMGGHVSNPTYQMVLTKKTGHAEVLHLLYDPEVVSYEKLLEIFWKTHDPTTLNRQGNDIGPQYRSVIFYHSPEQKELADKYKKLLDESEAFRRKIVTEITEASTFYPGPDDHQNYFNLNKKKNPYCEQIKYKLAKFRKVFPEEIDKSKDK